MQTLLLMLCRRPWSNRHGYYYPRDFKSRASANSATAAYVVRRGPIHEVNWEDLLRHSDILEEDVVSRTNQRTYIPTQTGLEPVTSAVTGRRSNQLSHWANNTE